MSRGDKPSGSPAASPAERAHPAARRAHAGIEDHLHRLAFGLAVRAEAWQLMADFTGTGMEHARALETAAEIFTIRKQKSVSHILLQMRLDLSRGSIMRSAKLYASENDVLMFSGEGEIEARAMYQGAARVARAQLTFRNAVLAAVFGHAVTLLALGVLFFILGTRLFPAIEPLLDPTTLPIHIRILASISGFFADQWILLLAGVIGTIAGISMSLRRWSGVGRSFADRIPPWSLYRILSSLTFLVLLVESGMMGRNLTTGWLLDLSRMSGPYVRRRVQGIAGLAGNDPAGIGAAALKAGYGWAPPHLPATLAAYAQQPGWLSNFSEYLDRWVAQSEARAKAAARGFQITLLAMIGITLGGTISTIFSLIEHVQMGV